MFKTVRRRFARGALTVASAGPMTTLGGCAPDAGPGRARVAVAPAPPATRADGQWIWTDADLRLWRAARARRPALRPGVWTSTVTWERGAAVQRLARSPRVTDAAGRPAPVAVVVRVDDALHRAWGEASDSVVAAVLDARLAALLPLVSAAGAPAAEVQLDYDCPVRRLARWAAVVARLRAGALRGREVWVTSLPAHLAEPGYGALFRGVVSGHILQLFDTGLAPDSAAVPRLAGALRRAALPYRVGLGAFERVVPAAAGGGRTRHLAWARALPALADSPAYRGAWVFPGGQAWTHLVAP